MFNDQAERVVLILEGLAKIADECYFDAHQLAAYIRWLAQQAREEPADTDEAVRNVWITVSPETGFCWFGERIK